MVVPDTLLYRNQFILGPRLIENLASWKGIKINNSICVTAHPDLNTYHAVQGDRSITLLGFVLDPDIPEATDTHIVDRLLHNLSEAGNFAKHTYKLGGRWIFIVNDGREISLFNDAAGLRQVFYTETSRTKELWCASQPGIIAELLNLQMDREGIEFINSYEFRTYHEFRWPAYGSPYKGIRHMLPNHCLDLKTGVCRRFWPDGPTVGLPLHEAVEKISGVFQSLMKSAALRYDLALSVTAGLDSRLVLAASKEISSSVSYMTVRQFAMPDDHADVTTPSGLLSRLGLKHDIVKSSLIMDAEFANVFKRNVPIAHYAYAPDAYAIWLKYGLNKVAVTGSASEIARSSFREEVNKPLHETITPHDLALLQRMGKGRYVLNSYEEWLSGIENTYNLDILDLFEWEQGHGNWLAMCQLEFDIAWKDIFTPFNCRDLLITMLSVNAQYRKPPRYELFERLIQRFWPEVLSVPINPHYQKMESIHPGIITSIRTQVSRHLPNAVKRNVKKVLRIP